MDLLDVPDAFAAGELIQVTDDLGGTVSYLYDATGNLTQTTQIGSAISVISSMTYDVLGRKLTTNDADMGNWTYKYNAFGELIEQKNGITPSGQVTKIEYDLLGRMVRRRDFTDSAATVLESDSGWLYDLGSYALGKLSQEVINNTSGAVLNQRDYSYDRFSRLRQVDHTFGNPGSAVYRQRTTYDQHGRVFQQFDADLQITQMTADDQRGSEIVYNQYGFAEKVIESRTSATSELIYSQVIQTDERGSITERKIGGFTEMRQYEADTGRLTQSRVSLLNAIIWQDLQYQWDEIGNLLQRQDFSRLSISTTRNLTETFTYDDLNRLTAVTGPTALTVAYNGVGSITNKSDVGGTGSYSYHGTKKHAATSVGGVSYVYNGNGSMTSGEGKTISYGVHNLPTVITRSSTSTTVTFDYDANRNRFKRVDTVSGNSTVTYYVGNSEIIVPSSGPREHKRYVGDAILTLKVSNDGNYSFVSDEKAYVFRDHLGSSNTIVSDLGTVLQFQSFDPWGKRRNDATWAAYTTTQWWNFPTTVTRRGFTGHEHVDSVGLIHMNGRMYDPRIARFISADPTIDGVTSTQGFNRYSYVHNNPLNATDPTGFWSFSDFNRWGMIGYDLMQGGVGYLASKNSVASGLYIAGGTALATFACTPAGAGPACGAAASAFLTYQQAVFQGASIGDATRSGVFAGITGLAFGVPGPGGIVAGSIVSGLVAEAQGGSFGAGFRSAMLSSVLSSAVGSAGFNTGNMAANIAIRAVIGGTISEVTGGSFANGAVTAAMVAAVDEYGGSFKNRERAPVELNLQIELQLAELGIDFSATAEFALPSPDHSVPDAIATREVPQCTCGFEIDYSATYGTPVSRLRDGVGDFRFGLNPARLSELHLQAFQGMGLLVGTGASLSGLGRGGVWVGEKLGHGWSKLSPSVRSAIKEAAFIGALEVAESYGDLDGTRTRMKSPDPNRDRPQVELFDPEAGRRGIRGR